ncbi:hypothetical protein J5500_04390 [Candidatus Saccharibacteria bacterium]|nr:hypothetical protein [Candidatus Saccharibacteria bacterium]
MLFGAHVIGWKKVKLIDRHRAEDKDYLIDPPRRRSSCVKDARELARKFRVRNMYAEVETETVIVLPSKSLAWTIGIIAGTIMTVLLLYNHIDGMIESMITRDSEYLYGVFFAIGGTAVLGMMLADWIAETIIPNAAKQHALEMANSRRRKGRTVRFAQGFSLNEIADIARWAVEEELAEKRAARDKRRNRKQLKARAQIVAFPSLTKAIEKMVVNR